MNAVLKSGLVLATFAAASALAGCKAKEAQSTGFTQQNHLMVKDETLPFQRTYWNRQYDSKKYDELLVAPINTDYLAAQSFWEKVNVANASPDQDKRDIAAIAQYTHQSFILAAQNDPKHRFKLVEKAGPKTLILEVAITQLVPSKAVLNAIGYITFIPTIVTAVSSTATQSEDTGKGVIAIEGRIRDGATGEIIGMFADREHPKTAIVDIKSLTWWAPAKEIIDEWSSQLIGIANRPPGGVVKDAPAFELLVW